MATVRKRVTPSGKVRWQVRWWTPEGHQASETFDSEKKAKTLRGLIDANGQRLPVGYIKGQGFAPATTSLSVGAWCARAVAARSGIEERTRHLGIGQAHCCRSRSRLSHHSHITRCAGACHIFIVYPFNVYCYR